uniref:EF-hand domain-containing protein n=3 Tax=Chrysotila carterae TaxID=13221 RepID=A0A7S4EV41_CHRCT|mmetsp:Transcript_14542/g.31194  ORF Transcript_14542/g.31194 Transcript_14542/m.31194 type:complete len:201 (-) Transcript_14542:284-886(-)
MVLGQSNGNQMELAQSVFSNHALSREALEELDLELVQRGEAPMYVAGPAVMLTADLRLVLAKTGDSVDGKDLFQLVQLADADGRGTMSWPDLERVLLLRRERLEKEQRESLVTAAYLALGGTQDKEANVRSAALFEIAEDFIGPEQAAAALREVAAHKEKAVEELKAMGGSLDEEEEGELRDLGQLSFSELHAYVEKFQA